MMDELVSGVEAIGSSSTGLGKGSGLLTAGGSVAVGESEATLSLP